jgi:hypothetical protein
MTPEQLAVQARWQGFLDKIQERADEILAEAYPGCMAVFVEGGHDPFTMGNVLPAVRSRLQDLSSKVQDTWFEKVSNAFFASGLSWDTGMTAEHAKLAATQHALSASFDAFEIRIKADAARMLTALLEKKVPTELRCTQCGGPIPVPQRFVAVNVQCGACRSVNTFEPGELRILHGFAIPALAHEAAWEEQQGEEPLPKPTLLTRMDSYAEELERWRGRLARG